MSPTLKAELEKLLMLGQRQDGMTDQLRDLQAFAIRLGMYDAADYIRKAVERAGRTLGAANQA